MARSTLSRLRWFLEWNASTEFIFLGSFFEDLVCLLISNAIHIPIELFINITYSSITYPLLASGLPTREQTDPTERFA